MQKRMYVMNHITNDEMPYYDLTGNIEINIFSELRRDAEFTDDYNRIIYISNSKVDSLEVTFEFVIN